jgi:proteic killer suppression protein
MDDAPTLLHKDRPEGLAGRNDQKDLESPPGNRLEALSRDRAGQHSVRINDQWRIRFVWTKTGPTDVEITNHYR